MGDTNAGLPPIAMQVLLAGGIVLIVIGAALVIARRMMPLGLALIAAGIGDIAVAMVLRRREG